MKTDAAPQTLYDLIKEMAKHYPPPSMEDEVWAAAFGLWLDNLPDGDEPAPNNFDADEYIQKGVEYADRKLLEWKRENWQ